MVRSEVRSGDLRTTHSGNTDGFGDRLRAARRRLRLSQTAVAEYLGVTRQAVAAFEQGTRQPDLRQLAGLANLYRQSLDELTGARSAIRPVALETPFRPRYNALKTATADDKDELAAFAEYLSKRARRGRMVDIERKSMERIRDTVHRWKKANHVDDTVPVPIFAIIARLGIEVRFTALETLAGATIRGDDVHPDGVLINSDQPSERQRYSAAHELGHLALKHEPTTAQNTIISPLGRSGDVCEIHADQFSAELLTPTEALLASATEERERDGDLQDQVYRLASKFMVSFQAMTTRLAKLDVLTPQEADSLSKCRPTDIAKRLGTAKARRLVAFDPACLPDLITEFLPRDWAGEATAETVRLLQETAYSHYVVHVPEAARSDSAAKVYERVATWIAEHQPLIPI